MFPTPDGVAWSPRRGLAGQIGFNSCLKIGGFLKFQKFSENRIRTAAGASLRGRRRSSQLGYGGFNPPHHFWKVTISVKNIMFNRIRAVNNRLASFARTGQSQPVWYDFVTVQFFFENDLYFEKDPTYPFFRPILKIPMQSVATIPTATNESAGSRGAGVADSLPGRMSMLVVAKSSFWNLRRSTGELTT